MNKTNTIYTNMAGYLNDPREMAIRPESGVTLENDNRKEEMWHWRAMVLDLCNMPVEEYMKPGFSIGSGGTTGNTPQTDQVKIYMSILKNGSVMGPDEVSTYADSGETDAVVWEAKWEWTGTIVMPVKVAAVIRTEIGTYSGSTVLTENGSKSVTLALEGAQGENLVAIDRFGVGSTDMADSAITSPSYSYTDTEANKIYKYEVSLDKAFISFKVSFVISGSEVYSEYLKEGEEIPFDSVSTDKEGYTFIGWTDKSGNIYTGTTMPGSDLVLTGKYEISTYTVTFAFDLEGVTEELSAFTQTVQYGKKVSRVPSTIRTGYVFDRWEPSIENPITADTDFVGYFDAKEYTVTWSGYTDGPIVETYKYGQRIVEPESPEKEGYTFTGWNRDIPEAVTSNLTFVAQFSINKYEIRYYIEIDGEKGEPVSSYTQNYGSKINLRPVPYEAGYTFSEWSGYTGTTVPAHDIEYVSIRTVNVYALAYYDNGDMVHVDNYKYMAHVTPWEYIKEGWTVSEWEGVPDTMPHNNVSAHCTSEINYYDVVFVDQDETEYTQNVPYGTPISGLVPQVEGHTFVVDDESILEETVGASDMRIEGTLVPNMYQVTINISGQEPTVIELQYGTNIQEYVMDNYPAEVGYTLKIQSNYDTVPANDNAVVNISYEVNVWTLTWSTTGAGEHDLVGSASVAYNTAVLDVLPETGLEGHVFGGWYDPAETEVDDVYLMPDNDLAVHGAYTVEQYTVIILDGDSNVFEKAYPYGTLLSSVLEEEEVASYVEITSANGYTVKFQLSGETVTGDEMLTGDITLNVSKIPNQYRLAFFNGTSAISDTLVDFGTVISYPVMSGYTDESGTEYVFVWEDVSYSGQTMPAHEVVITGNYEEKPEDIFYHGYFVIPVSAWTPDTPEVHFNIDDLDNPDIYVSAATKDYIGVGKNESCIIGTYEPFVSLTTVQFLKERDKWYAPFSFIFPVSVVDKYNIQVNDAIDWNILPDCYKSSKPVQINGIDYWFYVCCTEGLRPGRSPQEFIYTIILTEK